MIRRGADDRCDSGDRDIEHLGFVMDEFPGDDPPL
jgi:hypothetical protein